MLFRSEEYFIIKMQGKEITMGHSHGRFPGGSDGKASACNVGDPGSILDQEDPLEKEMTIHSSTLAWKIQWMEEPDRLQPIGSQKVGHD